MKNISKDNMLAKLKADLTRPFLLFLSLFSVLLLAACEPSGELSEKQRVALEKRVYERWQARIDHDFDRAWEYSTPNYRRSFPKELYVKKFSYAVNWELTGIEVLNYDARAAVASVVVRVMSEPTKLTSTASRAIGAVPLTIREKWILIDGEWWYSTNA